MAIYSDPVERGHIAYCSGNCSGHGHIGTLYAHFGRTWQASSPLGFREEEQF